MYTKYKIADPQQAGPSHSREIQPIYGLYFPRYNWLDNLQCSAHLKASGLMSMLVKDTQLLQQTSYASINCRLCPCQLLKRAEKRHSVKDFDPNLDASEKYTGQSATQKSSTKLLCLLFLWR